MLESLHGKIPDNQDINFYLAEARRSFLFYLRATDPKYVLTKAHVHLAGKLQQVAEGKIKRLIITTPPRVGKSRLVSIEFPSWVLGRQSDREIIVAGYAQQFINKHSRDTRSKVLHNKAYQQIFPHTRVVEGDSTINNWAVTGGGRYKAVGVGGAITGLGMHIGICDDLVKDMEAALSATQLEKTWEWFLSTFYTRLHPTENALILTMTRWSRDDIVGRLTDPAYTSQMQDAGMTEPWEVINLPALAEENDPLGRKVGDPLAPERMPLSKWMSDKAVQTDYIWSALYCGHPVSKGGNYIKCDNIETVDEDKVPEGIRWCRYWDLAATDKKTSDYQASIKGAIDPSTQTIYLKDGMKFKAAWPATRERIKDTAIREKIPIGIECVAGFKTAFANILEVLPPDIHCTEFNASKDKLVRALPWIAMAEKWKVKFVRNKVTDPNDKEQKKMNEWISAFRAELEAFPHGAHDDALDSISGVYQMITGGIMLIAPVHNAQTLAVRNRQERSMAG